MRDHRVGIVTGAACGLRVPNAPQKLTRIASETPLALR